MAVEEATEARLPFGMGNIDLTSISGVFAVVALILGFIVYHMTDRIGQRGADWVNSQIGAVTGSNPATGESTEAPSV
jgi:hypothetical protein